jgi:serine phosphatase RsbU (regulator of sigma subunit)
MPGTSPHFVVRSMDGRTETLPATSLPLWIVPGLEVPMGPPTHLGAGDVLFVAADGATEAQAPGGERFGQERLGRWLATRNALESAHVLVDAAHAAVCAWTGPAPLEDDLTMLAVKAGGRAGN